jgi:LacI family transcriptional regulator
MAQIKDVANAAGVSQSTVSRVLNRPDRVKYETKEKVYDAIRKLSYVHPKKETATRSYTIGLAIPDIAIDFVGELIRITEQELDSTQYDLLLFNMKRKRQISRFFRENVAFKKKVDALIIFSATLDHECVDFFRALNIPIVLLQSRCEMEKSISTNNYLGGFDCVQFLIRCGYKKIAFIGWEPKDDHLLDRFHGYKNALEEAGLEYSPQLTSFGSLSRTGGFEATAKLLERTSPEAIFYACDSIAFGGYQYLRENAIAIPDDIGIVGFDDLEMASVLGLTTMKQFIQVKVKMAVSYLLDRLSGKETLTTEEICISPKLLIRGSTRERQQQLPQTE